MCITKFHKECKRYRRAKVKEMEEVLSGEWNINLKVKDKHIIVTINDEYKNVHRIREVIPIKNQYILVGYFIGRVLSEYDKLQKMSGKK